MKAGKMRIEQSHGLEKNMLGPNLSSRECASREYGEFLQRKPANVTELRQLLPSFVVAETG
ncbi:MAG TPA: hypothetical protein VK129_12320, partial [Terriglobales bacterium]|nr:hypothetical protein [Terriglobales bacterium]